MSISKERVCANQVEVGAWNPEKPESEKGTLGDPRHALLRARACRPAPHSPVPTGFADELQTPRQSPVLAINGAKPSFSDLPPLVTGKSRRNGMHTGGKVLAQGSNHSEIGRGTGMQRPPRAGSTESSRPEPTPAFNPTWLKNVPNYLVQKKLVTNFRAPPYMACMVWSCVRVPKTTSRFSDLLEGLAGLSKRSHPQF